MSVSKAKDVILFECSSRVTPAPCQKILSVLLLPSINVSGLDGVKQQFSHTNPLYID